MSFQFVIGTGLELNQMGGIGLGSDFFQETGIGIGIDPFGRAELSNSILAPPIHTST